MLSFRRKAPAHPIKPSGSSGIVKNTLAIMAAKNATGALSKVKTFLESLPFKAPWKVAGPIVSSEWKSADLNVEEYRRSAPG